MDWLDILSDGFFAAIAAIGFGVISRPPLRALPSIALLAAIGHAIRFCLMKYVQLDIATSSFFGSLVIGLGSLYLGGKQKCPNTVLFIPALLPMIPGMYAYRTVFSLLSFLNNLSDLALRSEYMMSMFYNGIITCSVVFMLAAGASVPILLFSAKSYSLTRPGKS